jgi:hypothetical protein
MNFREVRPRENGLVEGWDGGIATSTTRRELLYYLYE